MRDTNSTTSTDIRRLKTDLFGCIDRLSGPEDEAAVIRRDTRPVRPGLRWIARRLARREARALRQLNGMQQVPQLIDWNGATLKRSMLPGEPMNVARPTDPAYFRNALHLLRRLHRHGIAHNDLAKEPNWLVAENNQAGIIDFQLACYFRRRNLVFRLMAREDLRHLLKHKRYYCAEHLSARQRKILASPSWVARMLTVLYKPVYMGVTRKLLGWADREGTHDRSAY
ncbi:MAG: serine/threonine protein kinase [Gammaproteobacteria bacterium]